MTFLLEHQKLSLSPESSQPLSADRTRIQCLSVAPPALHMQLLVPRAEYGFLPTQWASHSCFRDPGLLPGCELPDSRPLPQVHFKTFSKYLQCARASSAGAGWAWRLCLEGGAHCLTSRLLPFLVICREMSGAVSLLHSFSAFHFSFLV